MGDQDRYPLQLTDVRLFEVTLRRDLSGEQTVKSDEGVPHLVIEKKLLKHNEDLISVFLTLDIQGQEDEKQAFTLRFTLEGLFVVDDGFDQIPDEIWKEFEEHSAISLLWPYAQEYTQNFSVRMHIDLPVLPTLSRLALVPAEKTDIDRTAGSN